MCQIVHQNILRFCLLTIVASVSKPSYAADGDITLTILHTNDVHARFRQTNKYSGSCSEQEEIRDECYGGFPRLHYKVKEIRASHKNVLYLSGGDYYQGTVWYTLYKWEVVAKFVNMLNHTAMAFGNHEFDDGIAGLVPFVEAATFPIISSNIDSTLEPTLEGKFKKSIVVEIEGGTKVGLIGFTTTETRDISKPEKLIINDEVESIKEESERLYAEGVNILIAVGHAGYDVDQKIAERVPLIDAVVGGHTNTFLYHGDHPDAEQPLGEYPTVVTQPSGRKIPVVQAYAFGKYLGYLNLTFNQEGEVVGWGGNPILLNGLIPQDQELLELVDEWGRNITELMKLEIGKTRVFLNGTSEACRMHECNLANLVTDAMIYTNLKYADEVYWSDVTMAIMNGGGIRASIDERSKNGSISMDDILTVLPFGNTIDLITIKGVDLREAFEHSVVDYDPKGFHLAGKFLQVSGIKVVYDVTKPNGHRVKTILVRCKKCRVPSYVPLDDNEVYKLAIPNYIAIGGDGYYNIRDTAIEHHLSGILDSDMIIEYIQSHGPIIHGIEGRITFENEDSNNNTSGSTRCVAEQASWKMMTIMLLALVNFAKFS